MEKGKFKGFLRKNEDGKKVNLRIFTGSRGLASCKMSHIMDVKFKAGVGSLQMSFSDFI